MKFLHGVKPDALADTYRAAVAAGATVKVGRSNHVIIRLPNGRRLQGPMTSGDRRSALNLRTRLKRAGLTL